MFVRSSLISSGHASATGLAMHDASDSQAVTVLHKVGPDGHLKYFHRTPKNTSRSVAQAVFLTCLTLSAEVLCKPDGCNSGT